MVWGGGGAIDGVLLVCLISQDGQNLSGVLIRQSRQSVFSHHRPGPLHPRPAGGVDDLIHGELSIVVGVKVSASDLSDVVVLRRDFHDHHAPFGDRADGVAKAGSTSWHRRPLDGVIQRSSLQQGAGDEMPAHAQSHVPGLDVVNGEADTLGVETEGVAAEESRIRKRGEGGFTLDFGVDKIQIALESWGPIFVVSNQYHVLCDQSTIGAPLNLCALEERPIFPPQVNQEQLFKWPPGPLGDPFKFGEIVAIAKPMQFQELSVSRLPRWGAMVGQNALLEETVAVKRAMNPPGKPLTNSESNLAVGTAGLKPFNHCHRDGRLHGSRRVG